MIGCILLAAGKGKRFKSKVPKVLHKILGRPMFYYPLKAFMDAFSKEPIVVVVQNPEPFRENLHDLPEKRVIFAIQNPPLGTADAVKKGFHKMPENVEDILILMGDVPLIKRKTLRSLYETYKKSGSKAVILTCSLEDPKGYGRIVRDSEGKLLRIVEESDASPEEKRIKEINTGIYIINREFLEPLDGVSSDNVQGEFYLTDLFRERGDDVTTLTLDDPTEVMGVNTRIELVEAIKVIRRRINERLALEGVTFLDPDSVSVDVDVKMGSDVTIYPNVFIEGKSIIGSGVTIGPSTRILSSTIGDDVEIEGFSVIKESVVEKGVKIGPFSHIRPGTTVKEGAKIGNFVEIKKSTIGRGTKINHLAYVGDSEVGEAVNIGAGAITCNYDGYKKYKTIIEDGAFIGSDAQLVAPVRVGKNAVVGAGSTITKDVPDGALAVTRVKQRNVPGWKERIERKRGSKAS